MEIPFMHDWQAPLVLKTSDEMYGTTYGSSCHPPRNLAVHGWKISMGGMQHLRRKLPPAPLALHL